MNTFARHNRRHALRCLIANSEALAAHYAAWELDLLGTPEWLPVHNRGVAAGRRLADARAEAAELSALNAQPSAFPPATHA